jgi:chitin disaccharide deacetylase
MVQPPLRHIWLCADDYGISHGVNTAIRELIMRGRINATSVMVLAPHFDRGDARSLQMLNAGTKRAALGLHLTLTAPFEPVSESFTPKRGGRFLPMKSMQLAAIARRLNRDTLKIEIAAQVHAFAGAFGHLPDYIDGHQHVHLFPQVREALLEVMARMAPKAWVRQCGRARAARRLRDPKALTLDVLSVRFRQKARQAGIATNPAFAGSYSFSPDAAFAKIFPRFLDGLPDGGLIMCHPGFVDAELKRLDTLTALREREYEFFMSDDFVRLMKAHNVALGRPPGKAESAAG